MKNWFGKKKEDEPNVDINEVSGKIDDRVGSLDEKVSKVCPIMPLFSIVESSNSSRHNRLD